MFTPRVAVLIDCVVFTYILQCLSVPNLGVECKIINADSRLGWNNKSFRVKKSKSPIRVEIFLLISIIVLNSYEKDIEWIRQAIPEIVTALAWI